MVNGKKLNNFPTKLLLASPRGFCAGVKRAIDILDNLIEKYPHQTIYCYHQIVHNTTVVKNFQKKGVVFVDNLDEIPDKSIVVFSSHGVSPAIKKQTISHKLTAIDATCPYVTKTHLEIKKYASNNIKIIYIGQPNHDETIGAVGEAPNSTIIVQTAADCEALSFSPNTKVALITQTTLSFDETESLRKLLKKKFPDLAEPVKSDICMATQNRQNGVKELVKQGVQVIIVLGSPNSSNSNKLKSVSETMRTKAYLLDQITDLNPQLLHDIKCVGLTAGASLPERKITEALDWFRKKGTKITEINIADEDLNLPLPEINLSKTPQL